MSMSVGLNSPSSIALHQAQTTEIKNQHDQAAEQNPSGATALTPVQPPSNIDYSQLNAELDAKQKSSQSVSPVSSAQESILQQQQQAALLAQQQQAALLLQEQQQEAAAQVLLAGCC